MGLQVDLVAVVDGNVSGRRFRAAVGHRGRSRPLGALRVTECGAEGVDGPTSSPAFRQGDLTMCSSAEMRGHASWGSDVVYTLTWPDVVGMRRPHVRGGSRFHFRRVWGTSDCGAL